ncbi:arylsulfatase [Sediminicola luteus]|uniref:Sulfatase N-terminal domain-containing protein n=1 Tax=Sediminicola luteus TaxID=319238 RepID=A0A2A4G7Z5_9FLAO|nr:arylsulfatase [Sediminicola luteus]PCE64084.1 hypothetical protein B7P33_12685 [Sediminicola luteus]
MFKLYWLALLLPLMALGYQQQLKNSKPNIIYILADDLGYGDLGSYGQKKFSTPGLDQLAANGLRFTQHYAGSAVCAPSRCSLLTGMDQGHADVRGNKSIGRGKGQYPLKDETETLAELLQRAGYVTGIIGKWGLGGPGTSSTPYAKGFDFFYGYNDQGNAHHYYPHFLWRNTKKELIPENQGGKRGLFSHDLFTQEAKAFIKENQSRPFFLYLPYTIPHADIDVPENDRQTYLGQFPETPYKGGHYYKQPTPKAAFAGMIQRMDRDIQSINDLLQQLGLTENTLVIFSSDNGPHNVGGGDPKFFNSSGGLRGIKRDPYEGGIRVPMIAKWPGTIAAGQETDHISTFYDVMPTLAELVGEKPKSRLNGSSFLSILKNPSKSSKKTYKYWEFHDRKRKWQAVRWGDWKGIRICDKDGKEQRFELFNLKTDPAEQNDIASQNPKVEKKIRKFMTKRVPSPVADWSF